MKDGFIKISAVTPEVIVADPAANAEKTAKAAEDAAAEGAALVVFPELGITGYTAGDLFLQEELLEASDKAVPGHWQDAFRNLRLCRPVRRP